MNVEPCCNCHWQEKIKLWWREFRQEGGEHKDINFLTLEIRDKTLRQKFNALELSQVKKRFERITIFLLLVSLLVVAFMDK